MLEGQIFDNKYRILRTLGQGGMAKVYLAENIKLGTYWAIKEIERKAGSGIDFLVEPNMLKKLSHPSLPRIFDIIEDEYNVYIIVDYIEGITLDKKLEMEGKLDENTVLDWAGQICEVLLYLHTYKPNPIIYRDMKPSNIILTENGTIKLVDFGIAREYKENSGNDTVYIGTRGYAAPEQYGAGQTDATTDIYSLGVTLYTLLTGKRPDEPPFEIKPVRYFDSSLSPGIERIICKCTRQDPSERYQSVKGLIADINKAKEAPRYGSGKHGDNVITDCGKAEGAKQFINFKKLILTVWDNAEFGCELAYTAAKQTGFSIILIDADLLSPKADLLLNVRKFTEGISTEGVFEDSGFNIVMDSIEKNIFTANILYDVSAKRKELKNLYILTGNFRLDNYEYYSDESFMKLIEKCYQSFDMVVLLVNRSIYDSYTIISLAKSDFNIIALRGDIDTFREYNSYLIFLKEKQHISPDKTKFVAFEYDISTNMDRWAMKEVTRGNYIGSVRSSCKRRKYRNLCISYSRRMEKEVTGDYIKILRDFNIVPELTLTDRINNWLRSLYVRCRPLIRRPKRFFERRCTGNACDKHTS